MSVYFTSELDCSASVVIATLNNSYAPFCETDSCLQTNNNCSIDLDLIDITFEQFIDTFYSNTSGSFQINPTAIDKDILKFSSQTVTDDDGVQPFNLLDFVLACVEENSQITRNNLHPSALITLQKDIFKYNSLVDVKGTVNALKWKEVLSVLHQLGTLRHPDELICFKVIFYYKNECFSKVPVPITFNFRVSGLAPEWKHYTHGLYKGKLYSSNPNAVSLNFVHDKNGNLSTLGKEFKLLENTITSTFVDNNNTKRGLNPKSLDPNVASVANAKLINALALDDIENEICESDYFESF